MFAGSTTNQVTNGSAGEMGRKSYVGRVNYSFKDKYLVETILRADASAKFPADTMPRIYGASAMDASTGSLRLMPRASARGASLIA